MKRKYALDRARAQASDVLAATGLVAADAMTLVEPKPNIPADLAFPIFAAAKSAGANPADFARRVADAVTLPADSLLGAVEAADGFVNIHFAPERFARAVLDDVFSADDAYGRDAGIGAEQTLVVEFSSPNIARKMHVGHLRTTVIGNSLRNILVALGYRVITDNHLGDWGTQFGSLLAAHALWGWPPQMETDPVEALVQIYARFHAAAEADPALRDLARQWFKRLESGDEAARATWKQLVKITLEEFDRTYQRLNITFDTTHGESFYEPMLESVVREAIDKGVARVEADGAVSVGFGEALPSYLLQKSDGATLYQTRDVATCLYRWHEYAPARNIYVVGQEQTLHFQQVFETVRRMGYPEIADRSVHISFGAVTDVGGQRFSMRRGTAIFLDEVLDEAVARARQTIGEKMAEGKTELSEAEQETTAEIIGIGAIIYNDLYQGPERGIRFDWDKLLSFEGNTALYIQYTHARCRSILRKADLSPLGRAGDFNAALLTTPEEQAVLKQLARLPHALREAGEKFLPALIAEWTYNLAREFARFYHEHPVLDAATPELRQARLGLVQAVGQGLRNGLALLGIRAPERM